MLFRNLGKYRSDTSTTTMNQSRNMMENRSEKVLDGQILEKLEAPVCVFNSKEFVHA